MIGVSPAKGVIEPIEVVLVEVSLKAATAKRHPGTGASLCHSEDLWGEDGHGDCGGIVGKHLGTTTVL